MTLSLQYIPAGLAVKWEDWLRQNTKSIELVSQGTLPRDVLSGVGSIQTIDTVHTKNSSLISSNVVVVVPITPSFFETGQRQMEGVGRGRGEGGSGEREGRGREWGEGGEREGVGRGRGEGGSGEREGRGRGRGEGGSGEREGRGREWGEGGGGEREEKRSTKWNTHVGRIRELCLSTVEKA